MEVAYRTSPTNYLFSDSQLFPTYRVSPSDHPPPKRSAATNGGMLLLMDLEPSH